MSITKTVLKILAPLPKIEDYDRFLFIGPHPDDIEIGAGATVAKLTAMGKQVTFLICTDGRYGLTNAPEGMTPEELIPLRQKESLEAAAVLGVKDVQFLPFEDGGFYDKEALTLAMARVVGEVQPQVLFAPDPCVDSECHVDHLRTGECARRVVFAAHSPTVMGRMGAKSAPTEAIAYYMTGKPNRFVGTKGFFDRQLQALACHESQFPADCSATRTLHFYLKLRAFDFGLRTGKGKAEGFRLLDATHMHCLPEADL